MFSFTLLGYKYSIFPVIVLACRTFLDKKSNRNKLYSADLDHSVIKVKMDRLNQVKV